MNARDLVRFKHMLESAETILSFIDEKDKKHFLKNTMLASAVIRHLEIIGEAAVAISAATKKAFPDFPWKQMIGMRNQLIHAYFDIDNEIIWKTATESVPELVEQLKLIIYP